MGQELLTLQDHIFYSSFLCVQVCVVLAFVFFILGINQFLLQVMGHK